MTLLTDAPSQQVEQAVPHTELSAPVPRRSGVRAGRPLAVRPISADDEPRAGITSRIRPGAGDAALVLLAFLVAVLAWMALTA